MKNKRNESNEKVRQAINKIQACKYSCKTILQAESVTRMVNDFKRKYEGIYHEGKDGNEWGEYLMEGLPQLQS